MMHELFKIKKNLLVYMKIRKITLVVLTLIVGFFSCKKDDDGGSITTVEVRDRAEQQGKDEVILTEYLETHYYNSGDFTDPTTASIDDLVITKLAEGETTPPAGNTLLIDDVITKPLVFLGIDYEIYYLSLNEGGGAESPTFADNVFVTYEGFTLDGDIFDSAINPVSFDLLSLIPAWRKVLPEFNVAESFVELGDGTVDFNNHGTGVMFAPSGLAYFSNATAGISAYESIAFKFELLKASENDHDSDGVPSYKEDINEDGEFTFNTDSEDGDDTDDDTIPNHLDNDDDGDGVLTRNEDLEDTDLNVDSDGDGDPTNDKDGDGDPTNDDTDGDGIPNYLDTDDAISKDL